ncbi:hypothetical protein BC351_01320 [Paenibacillus ferrarius]|uniref:Poly A polymerase head domain-containing protein n=1 Tax=Paenibacillus ferrarius TaxID=1469647 RepID=A0A1V4HSL2_9BACL|nr:hypothetical protein [Paenibacillus ferrarius]OPH61910.1 hypothetical protein BC351_01320 [Paenibacillus ferrarius]
MNKYNFKEFLSRFMNDVDDHELFAVLKGLPDFITNEMWLAGGAIRRTLIGSELSSDFDLFFKNEAILKQYAKSLEGKKAKKTAETEHHITYCLDIKGNTRIIQLIKIGYYESPEAVIDTFDFTIAQFAYDGTDLFCGRYSLWDLSRKRLALHKLTYGVATMRRLIKYTKQDFTACAGVMQSILEAVVNDPKVVQSNIQYID